MKTLNPNHWTARIPSGQSLESLVGDDRAGVSELIYRKCPQESCTWLPAGGYMTSEKDTGAWDTGAWRQAVGCEQPRHG